MYTEVKTLVLPYCNHMKQIVKGKCSWTGIRFRLITTGIRTEPAETNKINFDTDKK